MRAVFYEAFGQAGDVLRLEEVVTPEPGAGEVLVELRASGVNPSDVKLRAGARPGAEMDFARVIPHSDGAGVIAEVGANVPKRRVGERVWVWNAQWQRASGTAAEYVALPSAQAVRLPDGVDFATGATLGIPAMTAWYALYGEGEGLDGQRVLVTGGAGAVGRYACQMAALGGAEVIATVSSEEKARHSGAGAWVDYRQGDWAEAVLEKTGGIKVDLVVDVDFGANQEAILRLLRPGGSVVSYASASARTPDFDFYTWLFLNARLRTPLAYLIPEKARRGGEAALTAWLEAGEIDAAVVDGGGLEDTAAAHEMVAAGKRLGTVVLKIGET